MFPNISYSGSPPSEGHATQQLVSLRGVQPVGMPPPIGPSLPTLFCSAHVDRQPMSPSNSHSGSSSPEGHASQQSVSLRGVQLYVHLSLNAYIPYSLPPIAWGCPAHGFTIPDPFGSAPRMTRPRSVPFLGRHPQDQIPYQYITSKHHMAIGSCTVYVLSIYRLSQSLLSSSIHGDARPLQHAAYIRISLNCSSLRLCLPTRYPAFSVSLASRLVSSHELISTLVLIMMLFIRCIICVESDRNSCTGR